MAKTSIPKSESTVRVAYRISEVAAMTGIPASTIRTRIHAGDIAVITSFGPWIISKSELDRLLSITLHDD